MIPRLSPRRSPRLAPRPGPRDTSEWSSDSREHSSTGYFAPSVPHDATRSDDVASLPLAPHSPNPQKESRHHEEHQALGVEMEPDEQSKTSSITPSPLLASFPDHDLKSPIPSDSSSDFGSDFSVTPPVTGPRPLVVSAKRLGQDVRRKHSKRRRYRSRRAKNVEKEHRFCLWQVGNEPRSSVAGTFSDSSDDDMQETQENLPFLFPQELSPQAQTKQYWEWCYGEGGITKQPSNMSWSASRAPPVKSCLSLSNPRPRLPPNHQPRLRTPPMSPSGNDKATAGKRHKSARVQFGSPKAVEYEIDGPAGKLTPLPSEVIRERYSMDQKMETEAEVELTEETKVNSAVLAEWDDNFDHAETKASRRRKNRRSSSLFLPSCSLADDENDPTVSSSKLKPVATSPSVVVMKNLASLRMSPNKNDELSPTELDLRPPSNADDLSEISEDIPFLPRNPQNDVSTLSSTPSRINMDTSEFVVSLESFNVSGGALSTTPLSKGEMTPQRPPSRNEPGAATTPPSTNISLETIHSVGGALDLESPASTTQPSPTTVAEDGKRESHSSLSPIPPMGEPPFSIRSNYKSDDVKKHAGHAGRIDFVKSVLESTEFDQELDCTTVLFNLGKRRSENPVESLVRSLGWFKRDIVPLLADLQEQPKRLEDKKPVASTDKIGIEQAKILAQQRWKSVEIGLLETLKSKIDRTAESAAFICKKIQRLKSLEVLSSAKGRQKSFMRLEEEVLRLKRLIKISQGKLRFANAATAPFAALTCQATCHVADFRFEDYTEDCLHITFDHVVEGVQTNIDFDLKADTLKATVVSDGPLSGSLPQDRFAAKFHRSFLRLFAAENIQFSEFLPQGLNSDNLQEIISAICLWLGRLDAATMDLVVVEKECKMVVVEMPTIECFLHSGQTVELCYGLFRNQLRTFIPTYVSIDSSGKKTRLHNLPHYRSASYLQELIADVEAGRLPVVSSSM